MILTFHFSTGLLTLISRLLPNIAVSSGESTGPSSSFCPKYSPQSISPESKIPAGENTADDLLGDAGKGMREPFLSTQERTQSRNSTALHFMGEETK